MRTAPRRLIVGILKLTRLYGVVAAANSWRRAAPYRRWVRLHDADRTGPNVVSQSSGPVFSIIVPTHKYNRRYLTELIDSVIAQDYPHWELVVVNACTTASDSQAVIEAAQRDRRITTVRVEDNLHIAGNTNAGIAAAAGDYISFLDHDDTLAPQALGAMAQALEANPAIEVFYSDEDKLSDNGRHRFYPFFKPDLNHDLILTSNYVCHFLTVKASLLRKVKGLRSGYDGAQDYDLVLRLISQKAVFHHIPQMLYHWRTAEGSTAAAIDEKSYAATAGQQALADYVTRSRIDAEVVGIKHQPTVYRLRYRTDKQPKVLVVVASADQQQGLSTDYDGKVKFMAAADYSPAASTGIDVVVFVDSGVVAEHNGWLEELVGRAIQPDTGMVGAAVEDHTGCAPLGYVYVDQQLQLLEGEIKAPVFNYIGQSNWPRNYVALPPGCLAVKGGLLERHPSAFSPTGIDVVRLSLELFQGGLTNVFWPYAQMKRGGMAPSPPPAADVDVAGLRAADPHFNSNLRIHNRRPALRI